MPNKRAQGQTQITVSMPDSMLKAIDEICDIEELDRSKYVRRLIKKDLLIAQERRAKYGGE